MTVHGITLQSQDKTCECQVAFDFDAPSSRCAVLQYIGWASSLDTAIFGALTLNVGRQLCIHVQDVFATWSTSEAYAWLSAGCKIMRLARKLKHDHTMSPPWSLVTCCCSCISSTSVVAAGVLLSSKLCAKAAACCCNGRHGHHGQACMCCALL